MLTLAEDHMVFPMVFEAVYESTPGIVEDASLQGRLEKAVQTTCGQACRTAEFLKLMQFLFERKLFPIVMKGIICRSLYNQPEQRPSTDEDLLIEEPLFEEYHRAFLKYGLDPVHPDADIFHDYEVSYCNSHIYIELHKTPFPPGSSAYGDLNRFFVDVEERKTTVDIYGVPVTTMDPTDHIFYQICHAYKHFLNCGIGIRMVSDIVLYSMHHEEQIDWENVTEQCREINAFDFMSAVYRIGERYLFTGHFPDTLGKVWNKDFVDEEPLLQDILVGGVYGSSSEERLHSANITLGSAEAERTGDHLSVMKRTAFPPNEILRDRYPYLRERPFLLPVAWIQRLCSYIKDNVSYKRNKGGVSEAVRIGNERVAIMHRYGMLGARKKDSLSRRIYERSRTSAIAPLLSLVFHVISFMEYAALSVAWYLKGDRCPVGEEQAIVRENVTFIAKSFERQGMAKGLCRNISRFYPGARIILADDSREPLSIGMDNVTVINLPYNSGLGAGLAAALEQVCTPYVMRLDDDELLTIRSKVHRELQYLMEHEELDLVGFGHTTAVRLRSPAFHFREYYQSPMDDAPLELKIPHLTKLDDEHIVLGKVANIYLARTDRLKEVGFDPEIKVIDHHDFFWRAAGVLVSAAALNTVVFHRHDPYNKHYNQHRSSYQADLAYIKQKKSSMLGEHHYEKKTD